MKKNKSGGLSSTVHCDYTYLIPMLETFQKISEEMEVGAKKYTRDNWLMVDPEEHMKHLMTHLFDWLQHKKEEDITHAICRILMYHTTLKKEKNVKVI